MSSVAELADSGDAAEQPRRVVHGDFLHIARTMELAFKNDPIERYMVDPNSGHHQTWLFWLYRLVDTYGVMRGTLLYHTGVDPYRPALKDPLTKFVRWVSDKLGGLSLTEEQINRRIEIFTKSAEAEKASGIDLKTMLYLGSIGTTPAKQGRGYATTLLKHLTEEADSRSLKIYLLSSNIKANSQFYTSLGFYSANRFSVGEDNPTWMEPPFELEIMIREPVSGAGKVDLSV